MKAEITRAIKPALWGAVCGAIITMVIGFHWGGWTTSGTTEKLAREAVLNSEAAICAARFLAQPNHAALLTQFNKVDSWSRSDFIDKGGWDKMPGQEKASNNVADVCTERLNALAKN